MPWESQSTFHKNTYPKTLAMETVEITIFSDRCIAYRLSMIDYDEAYQLQKRLHHKRICGEIPDVLLLLEHPPTLTVGKSGSVDNVLVSKEELARKGIPLFFIGRGGDVTYHGPGQLVTYPIIGLAQRGRDIRGFVRNLEEVIIRTLEDFSISSARDESHPGVWVGKEEIAAIGLSVRRWVSMHGIALNVNTNLEHFSFINPCGFSDRKATSMHKVLGYEVAMDAVTERLIARFSDVFDTSVEDCT
jgi:lipoate-protein ligase B